MGSVHRKNILIRIQQDATLHSLFYLETVLHILGGITTHHQESKQLNLQYLLFVTPLLLPAAIVEELTLIFNVSRKYKSYSVYVTKESVALYVTVLTIPNNS
jgi:hypothetical protein